MKMSRLFTQTRREAPADSDVRHYQFLVRAGYIQPFGGSVFAYPPLGEKTFQKMAKSLAKAFDVPEQQVINLPLLQSPDLWQNAGRLAGYYGIRSGREIFPAPSYDAAVFELTRSHLRSYRQLPVFLFQRCVSWGAPAGGGLLRSRQNETFELYALYPGLEAQEIGQKNLKTAAGRFLDLLQLPAMAVEGSTGGPGDFEACRWFLPLEAGSATALFCDHCGYAASAEAARFRRCTAQAEPALPLEKVATPDCATIESLANFLNIPEARTAKAVFLAAETRSFDQPPAGELIFCVVRGDRPLNETALLNLLKADALRPAEDAEIRAAGAVPGYASPVGLKGVRVIVDSEIPDCPNLVSGANEEGFHFLNVNYRRDYQAALVAEIAQAQAGDPCPHCGQALRESGGVILGEILKAGPDYTHQAGCTFRDESGAVQPVLFNKASLSLTRLLACLAETHNDDYGLKFPPAAAPYPLHMVLLASKTGKTETLGEELYASLCSAGLEPLYDDRTESPGVKFNDADLIGLPLRLTVSERALQNNGIEFKNRFTGEKGLLPVEHALEEISRLLDAASTRGNLEKSG